MAAKTNVYLPTQTWNCTLEVLNQDKYAANDAAPTHSIGVECIAEAAWVNECLFCREAGFPAPGGQHGGPPLEHEENDPPPPEWEYAPAHWLGLYWPFRLACSTWSGHVVIQDTKQYWIWVGDFYGYLRRDPHVLEDDPIIEGDLVANVTISIAGLRVRVSTQETPPSSRGFMHFTDRICGQEWYLEEGGSVTVTATGPDGSTLSASKTITSEEELVGLAGWIGFTMRIEQRHFAKEGIVYARIGSPSWSNYGVDLTNLDLWYGGADPPWSGASSWGRTRPTNAPHIHVYNDGGPAIASEESTLTACGWTGVVQSPFIWTFKPIVSTARGEDARYEDSDVVVYAPNVIEWYKEEDTWKSRIKKFSGEYTMIEQWKSWEFMHEYMHKTGTETSVYVDPEWLAEQNENPYDFETEPALACALLVHPIDVDSLDGDPRGEWPTFIDINAEADIPVVKPYGIARPANWIGMNGLTPDPIDNDVWYITKSDQVPQAVLNLASRKILRMNRLSSRSSDPTYRTGEFIYCNRPNFEGEDWDPEEERIPENEWHWQNRCYAELRMKCPRDSIINIIVNYSEFYIEDPCYTCYEHRFGAEGEFYYETIPKQAIYEVKLAETIEGQPYSKNVIDLAVPKFGEKPPRMYHVNQIIIQLPDAPPDTTYEFNEIILLQSYWDPSWGPPPEANHSWRVYDPRNWWRDYTGCAGLSNGILAGDIPFGFEDQQGVEYSLKIRQKLRHCPESELEGIMDYAIEASRLSALIQYQRGWNATYLDPENSSCNKDEDGNTFFGTFRAFDLRCMTEGMLLTGAPKVGLIALCSGIPQTIYYQVAFRGCAHGMVLNKAQTKRNRKRPIVTLYGKQYAETEWQTIGITNGDAHGHYRVGDGRQKDYCFYVSGSPDKIFTLEDRKWYWTNAIGELPTINVLLDSVRWPGRTHLLMRSKDNKTGLYLLNNAHELLQIWIQEDAKWTSLGSQDPLIFTPALRPSNSVLAVRANDEEEYSEIIIPAVTVQGGIGSEVLEKLGYTNVRIRNHGKIVHLAALSDSSILYNRSCDGGATWGQWLTAATNALDPQVPDILVDDSGRVYIYYIADDETLFVTTYIESTDAWEAQQVIIGTS